MNKKKGQTWANKQKSLKVEEEPEGEEFSDRERRYQRREEAKAKVGTLSLKP